MKTILILSIAIITAFIIYSFKNSNMKPIETENTYNDKFYNISVKTINGDTIKLEKYKDKVILIVNTASKCGFTPQYEGLEELYKKYKDKGLVILGFPCNQFGSQEPGTEQEIINGCLINYGVSFDMFSKIEVNGENSHELYKYLKNELGGTLGDDIKWNFTKFLVNKYGYPIKRYAPIKTPSSIEPEIEEQLK